MKDPISTTNPTIHLPDIKNAYTDLVDYLKDLLFQKNILERPSYMELSKKLGFTYDWIKEKKVTLKSHSPMKKTFDDLFKRVSNRYEDLLKKTWKTIENKFQYLYDLAFPIEPYLPNSPILHEKSIKRKFFDDIKEIIRKFFPKARIFDTDLSRILFRRERTLKDSHLKGKFAVRRFTKSLLFEFIYKTRILTRESLTEKVRDIQSVDSLTLSKIKIKIERYIENFIFSNPYRSIYISDKHDTGTLYFKPEYDLTLHIWFILSKIRKKPIPLKRAQKLLAYDTFGKLRRGWEYSWDGIMNMLNKLITLIPSEEFSETFEKTWKYIELRNLYTPLPRIYHSSWYTLNTMKYHVIILIIRDLGLDILTLEPFEPEAFKKTRIMESFTFERHHIYINNKFSIDVNRLVLVMHKNHKKLEGKTDLILDLIQNRIDLTVECPQYYKENVRTWKQKWQEYLKRRTFLIENGIESFIKHYFTDRNGNNYILNRFFKNIPNGRIHQNIISILQVWIKKNRPAPILNTYILKRLFFGSPKILTSQLITIQT